MSIRGITFHYMRKGNWRRGGEILRGGGWLNTTSDMLAIREFSHSLLPVFVERTMINFGRGS